MAIIQSTESELRYMKRKNLEQEARMIGNQYRDIIRSYGIDCIYNKLNTNDFDNYKGIIDNNLIIERAYGYNTVPDYSCSASMITYMEVEQDIFQLQKYGVYPNADVNFYFDSTDFACALATKLGQYQEYKIDISEIVCEVPECTDKTYSIKNFKTKEIHETRYVSSDVFPYKLGLGAAEFFKCDLLSGKLSVEINGYEYDKEYQVVCDPYEHTDFEIEFPSNPDLYRSLKHKYKNDNYLQPLIYLNFKVSKVPYKVGADGSIEYKSILHGKIHGGILFYNLFKIGKYLDKIHPDVGDLVTIDFPDKENSEIYEITECYDKSLNSDGISPLLHKYIWKCKARRYINNQELELNEADSRLQEKIDLQSQVTDIVAEKLSLYENNEDAAYGGYDPPEKFHDKDGKNIAEKTTEYEVLDQNTALDIYRFAIGSRLVTDGYDLYFSDNVGNITKITKSDRPNVIEYTYFESGLRFLKATADKLVFVNINGDVFNIVEDEEATPSELELCLTSLLNKTLDNNPINQEEYNNFYIFKHSKTILWSTDKNLFCKLASNGKLYRIA